MGRLFATKPISKILAEAEGVEGDQHTLKRALGPINLITLGIGAIIGAGAMFFYRWLLPRAVSCEATVPSNRT